MDWRTNRPAAAAALVAVTVLVASCSHGGQPRAHHGRQPGAIEGARVDAPDPIPAACARWDAVFASIALERSLARAADGGAASDHAAESSLGQALICMRLYAPGLLFLDRSTKAPESLAWTLQDASQPPQPSCLPTLRWLVFLSRKFPRWGAVLDAVGRYPPSELEAPELADIRDEVELVAGRAAYAQGRLTEAIAVFGHVPAKSALYVEARLLEGAAHVRTNRSPPARAAFEAALGAAQTVTGTEGERQRDLAIISLARIDYSLGRLDHAGPYYDRISRRSVYWPESQFESAWTGYRLHDHARALAHLDALEQVSEAVAPDLLAEALLLRRAIEGLAGRPAQADRAAARFMAAYPPLINQLKALLTATPDDAAMFEIAWRARAGTSSLPPAVARVARWLLAQPSLAWSFEHVEELRTELARVAAANSRWKDAPIGRLVLADLGHLRSEAEREAGASFRRRIGAVLEHLGRLTRDALGVHFEPLVP